MGRKGFSALQREVAQIEDRSIVSRVKRASSQRSSSADDFECRHAFVLDGREHRAADQDLASGITFAFCLVRAREQSALLCAKTCDAFVERADSSADLICVGHLHTSRCAQLAAVSDASGAPR